MNVIDVTPRPAAVTGAVRFLQSPFMSILGILFILTALKWGTLLFVVPQYQTVIITRFGKIVRTITTPGLKMKLPVFDKLQRFDKRILAWDGPPIECPTKDKLYIIVDCFARWRISDPMLYYNRLNDERSALSRLDDILGSETRSAVATISSTATKTEVESEGKADAEAAVIYAAAFGAPDQQELYSFLRSLDVMRAAFEKDTTAVLSTNSDLGRMLKSMAEAVAPKSPPH